MYLVWTKAQYEEGWKLTECADLDSVAVVIRANFGKEVEVKVSTQVEFDAKIAVKIYPSKEKPAPAAPVVPPGPEIKPEVKGEAKEGKAKPDKNTSG